MQPAPSSKGFALVETLIAMALIAVMMTMLFATIASNAQMTRAMADRRQAVLIAQSTLDRAMAGAGADVPTSGESGAFRWQVAITPYEEREGIDVVTVTVGRMVSRTDLVRLRSLKLAS